jgi:predicted membrane channel-forming protein YqfA (hemolysin III family)
MRFLKNIIYYPFLWLRRIMKWTLNLLSIIFFISGLGSLFIQSKTEELNSWKTIIIMFSLSFICFLISQLYDRIILQTKPDNIDLTLID